MLYLIFGTDFQKVNKKIKEILDVQAKKNADAVHISLGKDGWNNTQLEELLGAQGLFQKKFVIVLDRLATNKDLGEEIVEKLEDMSLSQNIFILKEGEVTKEISKKVSRYAEKAEEFSLAGKGGPSKLEFNVFSLTDALGARDKKKLWVLYEKAISAGTDPEEVHRLFFWQIKSILTALNAGDVSGSGLNPFVYKKALGFAKNFSKEELANFSRRLVSIHHDARRGIHDMDIALEKFVLSI